MEMESTQMDVLMIAQQKLQDGFVPEEISPQQLFVMKSAETVFELLENSVMMEMQFC